MNNIRSILLSLFMLALFCGGLSARTYYLPDYQSDFIYGSRVNDTNSGHTSKPSCGLFGYYSAAERPADTNCVRVNSPAPGLECYTCSCSADYFYNSDNCSGSYVLSGGRCGGKYDRCVCDPTIFPSSSSGEGCPSGQKADTSASCTNKSDNTTVYKCIDDPCYNLVSKSSCENQGNYCVPSSKCASGCEQCIDRCEGYKLYEGAVSNCENGCAPGKEISGCTNLCTANGCKTCTPCGSEYVSLSQLPANVTSTPCTDCDGTTKYKPTGCQTGYADINTYWCSIPQNTQCASLGFTLNKSCDTRIGQIAVPCPFNQAYKACL